jgi:hypothetical protein
MFALFSFTAFSRPVDPAAEKAWIGPVISSGCS